MALHCRLALFPYFLIVKNNAFYNLLMKFHMFEGVIFDLDDTLFDGVSAHKKALERTYQLWSYIFPEDSEDLFRERHLLAGRALSGLIGDNGSSGGMVIRFKKMLEDRGNLADPDLIRELSSRYWKGYLRYCEPREGVLELFDKMKERQLKTAVCTNLTADVQLAKLKKLGLLDKIEVVVCSDDVAAVKPNPLIFQHTLERISLKPDQVLSVGDNIRADILGASAVGLHTALIENSFSQYSEEDIANAEYHLKSMRDLIKLLQLV